MDASDSPVRKALPSYVSVRNHPSNTAKRRRGFAARQVMRRTSAPDSDPDDYSELIGRESACRAAEQPALARLGRVLSQVRDIECNAESLSVSAFRG